MALQPRKIYWLIDSIVLLVVGYLGYIVWQLLSRGDWIGYGLSLMVVYIGLRIAIEFTVNRGKVPPLTSNFFERRAIVKALKEDAKPHDSYWVVDLGSGFGALSCAIARELPQAHVTGLEISKVYLSIARFMQKLFGVHNLEYLNQDFFSYDCRAANAVVLFLTPTLAPKVGEKLAKELKPGTLVISNEFPLKGGWEPERSITLHTPFKATILVYRKA